MERADDKDPFDYKTYYSENGFTIATMVELRAFCADFFENHIRTHTVTHETTMAKFINLITQSRTLFSRARAVIPELQVSPEDSSHPNTNIEHVLRMTQELRGPAGRKWSNLPEELVWSKLAKDGQVIAEKARKEGGGHKKQTSITNAQFLLKADEEAEAAKRKIKAKYENIPVFIPQNTMGALPLVWSPTRGTRVLRQDEICQTLGANRYPMTIGSTSSPTRESEVHDTSRRERSTTQTMDTMSGEFKQLLTGMPSTDSPQTSPAPRPPKSESPLMGGLANSGYAPSKTNNPPRYDAATYKGKQTPLHEAVKKVYGSEPKEEANHPVPIVPTRPTTMGRPKYPVNMSAEVSDGESFSPPSNMAKFQAHNASGQWAYDEYTLQFQPDPNVDYYTQLAHPTNFVPSPTIWGSQPAPQAPAPHNYIGPVPVSQASGQDYLVIPPPGHMSPVEYWDMLYQREAEIRNRLARANQPLTDNLHRYFAGLEGARLAAVATKIPVRGRMRKKMWLKLLEKEMEGIWKQEPGMLAMNSIVMARKRDYEKVVREEIDLAHREA